LKKNAAALMAMPSGADAISSATFATTATIADFNALSPSRFCRREILVWNARRRACFCCCGAHKARVLRYAANKKGAEAPFLFHAVKRTVKRIAE
jgi:hypothetical protein